MKQMKLAAAVAAVVLGLIGTGTGDATAGAASALRAAHVDEPLASEQVTYRHRHYRHHHHRHHYRPYVQFYTAPRHYYRPYYSYSYGYTPYRRYRW